MPIDDLTALGQKMREARKNKELTQQELSDLSHVSVKQIANIEKGKMNPSYLILRALAKVLHASLMLLGALMISIRCPKTSPLLLSAYRLSKVFCMS